MSNVACSWRGDSEVRRKFREREKIRRKRGRWGEQGEGRERTRSHPLPQPLAVFPVHISFTVPTLEQANGVLAKHQILNYASNEIIGLNFAKRFLISANFPLLIEVKLTGCFRNDYFLIYKGLKKF